MADTNEETASAAPPTAGALAALLRPATDLSASIRGVLEQQQQLAAHMAVLNQKLAAATAQSPEDRNVLLQVDAYVAKLRAARRRVSALQTSLEATKARLVRVHGYVKAKANVLERDNAATEEALEAELAAAAAS
uniref:Biogenesis of lysosome-related organelles complex 1 subunit 7 n=1 Tax=Neobodo designis TaxID=312471 RepID=A0A7S1QD66_NEODS|mmetsp:Transcript_39958/g.123462  ORF Transcript_39958/g.123462 Transcript_39958/m.123462 type:complete len:135 (+) Transcript_39958:34-438(+)